VNRERPLGPDEVAELEDQRDFLLRSLDDLDAERAAGDIDDTDFRALRDDYIRRTANVARAIEAGRASMAAPTPRPSGIRRLATFSVVVVFAALAGVLLARSAGFRSSTETATGDVRASTRTLLLEAGELAGTGDLGAAIERYDAVLEIQPSNAEALAYKAWYLYLGAEESENDEEIEALLDAAVASAPDYPDPRVFRAVLFTNQQRYDEASDELEAFDAADPSPSMRQLVDQQGLRERALVGRLQSNTDTEISVEVYGVTAETMARAGQQLVNAGEAGLGIRALGAALDTDPDNVTALVARGDLLVVTGQQTAADDPGGADELIADGRASIERAVDVDPTSIPAQLSLLRVAVITGDSALVARQLDLLDGFELDAADRELLDALRAALEG
jgi:tetratricopeptide (TPR) repeat protein